MKCYLTQLRHEGKRLAADRLEHADRLVVTRMVIIKGFRRITAICCFGGETVAQIWDPVLVSIGDNDLTIRGIERRGDAGVVQEWRLRPHANPPGGQARTIRAQP